MIPTFGTSGELRLGGVRGVLLGWVVVAVGLCLATADAALARQKSDATKKKPAGLEAELAKCAEKILKELHDRGCVNVGVLKFRTKRPRATKLSDNDGPINLRMADRLEVALVLALKEDAKIRILHRASDTVYKGGNRRVNHLTPQGRDAFFRVKDYKPAWGKDEPLKADAFLTGEVVFDPKLARLRVTVQLFDRFKKKEQMKKFCPFEAFADRRLLTEAGVSFTGARSRGSDSTEDQLLQFGAGATTIREESPVVFDILYDGKPVKQVSAARAGGEGQKDDFFVLGPKPKQKVTLRLRHRGLDQNTYGVVVQVNGENTIIHDAEDDPRDNLRWIVEPKASFIIRGFQEGTKQAREFTVVPLASAGGVRYSEHAGTFTVVVFRARTKDEAMTPGEDETGPVEGRPRGSLGRGDRQYHLKALQDELRKHVERDSPCGPRARGLLTPGKVVDSKVRTVLFDAHPKPVSHFTIRYLPRTDE